MVKDIAERSRSRRCGDDAMTGAVGVARLQTQRGIVESDVSATADEVYGTVDVAVAENDVEVVIVSRMLLWKTA